MSEATTESPIRAAGVPPVPSDAIQAAMNAPDVVPTETQGQVNPGAALESLQVDYFGFEDTGEFTFPDGISKIWFKAMNEGERSRFQRATNRDVQLERQTGNARVKTDPAGERFELIMASVTNWNLQRKNQQNGRMEPVPFSTGGPGSELGKWVLRANPKLVDALEEAIRKVNPWLVSDMSLEDIDREMDRLRELREEKVKLETEKEAFRS